MYVLTQGLNNGYINRASYVEYWPNIFPYFVKVETPNHSVAIKKKVGREDFETCHKWRFFLQMVKCGKRSPYGVRKSDNSHQRWDLINAD